MGDAARKRALAQKMVNDVFGDLPKAEVIAGLIDEANYDKLLVLLQDVQTSHGVGVANLLMQQVQMAYPEAHKKYKDQLKQSTATILNAHGKAVEQLNSIAHGGFVLGDYKVLLAEPTIQSHLIYVKKKFFDGVDMVDVQAFMDMIADAETVPPGYPEAWPDALKFAFGYTPLIDYGRQVYHNLPEELKTEDSAVIIFNKFARVLAYIVWEIQAKAHAEVVTDGA